MFDIEKYKRSLDAVHAPEDTLDKVYERLGKRGKVRKVSRIGLLAAILVPLFVATALAAGLGSMVLRRLGEGETEPCTAEVTYPDGHKAVEVYNVETEIVLEFAYEGDAKNVYFTPGWLPGENTPDFSRNKEGYQNIVWGTEGSSGKGKIMFNVYIQPGSVVNETKYIFQHEDTEVLRQEEWLEWQRVDVKEKFKTPDGTAHENNYILLFSEKYGYLLVIGGDQDAGSDFEVLEKIAENMTIIVSDVPSRKSDQGSDFAVISIGWG